MAIPGWIYLILIIGAVYIVYITITQPQAGMRIFGTIFTVVGRILYFVGIVLFKIAEGIYNLFRNIFRRKK
jgi:hypothetical protein